MGKENSDNQVELLVRPTGVDPQVEINPPHIKLNVLEEAATTTAKGLEH